MMLKRLTAIIFTLVLCLCLITPEGAAKNIAIKLAHWDKLGYTVKRTGNIEFSNGMAGDYVLLNHDETNVHAYVLWNKCPEGCDKFSKFLPGTWFSTIFMENIRPGTVTRLFPIETNLVDTDTRGVIVEEMRARFPDGFVEPDLITRVPVVGDQMLVVMMGMPHKGLYAKYGKNNCPRFKDEFNTMTSHLVSMMNDILPDISAAPLEMDALSRFTRNAVRAGYQSDCWIKDIEFTP